MRIIIQRRFLDVTGMTDNKIEYQVLYMKVRRKEKRENNNYNIIFLEKALLSSLVTPRMAVGFDLRESSTRQPG